MRFFVKRAWPSQSNFIQLDSEKCENKNDFFVKLWNEKNFGQKCQCAS